MLKYFIVCMLLLSCLTIVEAGEGVRIDSNNIQADKIDYRILSTTSNESIIWNIELIENEICLTPKITDGDFVSRFEEDEDGRVIEKIERYFIPDSLNVRNERGNIISTLDKSIFAFMFGDERCYTIPANADYIKIGEESIIIVGDATYSPNEINNLTQENLATHLNTSSVTPYDSLVLYYPFDADRTNVTAFDMTPSNYNGVYRAGTLYNTTDCFAGSCAGFNGVGTKNILLPVSILQTINLTNNFTITGWFKIQDLTGTKTIISTSGGGLGTNANTKMTIRVNSASLDSSIGNSTLAFVSRSNASMVVNRWYFFSYAVQGNNMSNNPTINLTINMLEAKGTSGATLGSASESLIGLTTGAGNRPFNGTIDDFMIFNTTLNSSQIFEIYHNQSARFVPTGNMRFDGLNFGVNNTANISVYYGEALLGSNIAVKVNGGIEQNMTTNSSGSANIEVYNITGGLVGANITFTLLAGNLTSKYYTPFIGGNITITDYFTSSSPVDSSCTYSGSGNWLISFNDFCNITTNNNLNRNNLTMNGTFGYIRCIGGNITNYTKAQRYCVGSICNLTKIGGSC